MHMIRKSLMAAFCLAGLAASAAVTPDQLRATLRLKTPGNDAATYALTLRGERWEAAQALPLTISQRLTGEGDEQTIAVTLTAQSDVYFHFAEELLTEIEHQGAQFYLPGFWYRQNLRSPKESPSFHTSDSWIFREDRLSTPMTTVFDPKGERSYTILRTDCHDIDALTTHTAGEVILSGKTSVGFLGFAGENGKTALCFGFPYAEAPKTYNRKLTLAPTIEAYQRLAKGESLTLTWRYRETSAASFGETVQRAWEWGYDQQKPQPVETGYSDAQMKEVISNFFRESYVQGSVVNYYSGVELETETCASTDVAEVGFVGRVLLNAFNALEYAEQTGDAKMAAEAQSVFDSYLERGLNEQGFFNEVRHLQRGWKEERLSIRRQSEGVYAVLLYLDYEKRQGREHKAWEEKVLKMLDLFLGMQNADGSLPRKFNAQCEPVDPTGGSTPSATAPLVMAYRYFGTKAYLEAAKKTVAYVEREIISKSDYFSSTLDANCEDKEAALAATTASYYLALVTTGAERQHYADLCKQAAYFALSWYYTWDVPFAAGQMLGDLGFKTRGWGNVSVENNHVDVFIFDFADILHWLAAEYGEQRFSEFSRVISSSMRQLLPFEGHRCGIAKTGYYPEVVQHTNWDYGRNGKGYYNNIFAPGWTVASLWEMLTPGRAEQYVTSPRKYKKSKK